MFICILEAAYVLLSGKKLETQAAAVKEAAYLLTNLSTSEQTLK